MPRFSTQVKNAFPNFEDEFAEVEQGIGSWASRLGSARLAARAGEARAAEKQQNNAQFLMAIYLGGIAVRVQELAEAVVSLVNKGNPHASAPVARALFETCCVPIYLQEQMVPRLRKGRVAQVHKLVFRIGLGTTGMFGAEHIRPIKVKALLGSSRAEIKSLVVGLPDDEKKKFADLIDIYYGPLTELTHPNYGAVTLSVEIGLPPAFHHPTPFEDWTMHSAVSSVAYILGAGGRALDTVLQELSEHPMDLPNGDPLEAEA